MSRTWVRHVVVVGPMGAGETCTAEQRADLVDLWAQEVDTECLIVACWEPHEIGRVQAQGMRPLVMMRCDSDDELLTALADLPSDAIAYTNPRYSRALITAAVVDEAGRRQALPDACKFSKVTLDDLARVRAVGGTGLQIIHGSSRHLAGSFSAGANLVVSSPLAALPLPWPAPTLEDVQQSTNVVQQLLDAERDHPARVAAIAAMARAVFDR